MWKFLPEGKLLTVEFEGQNSTDDREGPNVNTYSHSENFVTQNNHSDVQHYLDNNVQEKGDNSHEIPEYIVHSTKGTEASMFIKGQVYGKPVSILVDRKTDVTIFSSDFMANVCKEQNLWIKPVKAKLISATGNTIPLQGQCEIPINFCETSLKHKVLIADIKCDGILGLDFMTTFSCNVLTDKLLLQVNGVEIPIVRITDCNLDNQCKVIVAEDTVLPANSECSVVGRVLGPWPANNSALIEPNLDFIAKYEVFIAKTLIDPTVLDITLRMFNPFDEPLALHKSCHVADLKAYVITQSLYGHKFTTTMTGSPTSGIPEHLNMLYEKSCNKLNAEHRHKLKQLLIKYNNCFSSSSQDLEMTNVHGTLKPKRAPHARIAKAERDMQDMLNKGMTEQSETLNDVNRFIGQHEYTKFVDHMNYKFYDVANPLCNSIEKRTKFCLTRDCQNIFDKLKRALTSSSVFAFSL